MDQKETTERIKKLNSLINDRVIDTQVIDDNTIKLRTDNYAITAVFKDDYCIDLNVSLISIKQLEESIHEFQEYVNNLEDDIFLTACDLFKAKLGEDALSELNYAIEKKEGRFNYLSSWFRQMVSEAAYKKIETMIFKYFPEYKEFIENNGVKKINCYKDINYIDID